MTLDQVVHHRTPDDVDGGVIRASGHISLVRLQPQHLPTIHRHLTSSRHAAFWRSRGRYIPSHVLEEFLIGDGHDCLVVTAGDDVVGLVEVFDVSPVDGHAQLGALTWRTGVAGAFTVEALILAMDHWFCSLPIERFFIQTAKLPSQSFRKALDHYFDCCGVLPGYIHVDDTRHDVLIYSMTKQRYIELSTTTAYFRSLDVRCPFGIRSSLGG